MRKTSFYLVLCSFLLINNSFANIDVKDVGKNYKSCEFGKEVVHEVVCYGPGKLTETTVTGPVSVAGGPLEIEHAEMASMDVVGLAKIFASTIASNANITGFLTADNTKFNGNLLVDSNIAILSATSVKGPTVIRSREDGSILELHCRSRLAGDLVFEGKPGVVKVWADSDVAGKVVNGTAEMVKTDEKC